MSHEAMVTVRWPLAGGRRHDREVALTTALSQNMPHARVCVCHPPFASQLKVWLSDIGQDQAGVGHRPVLRPGRGSPIQGWQGDRVRVHNSLKIRGVLQRLKVIFPLPTCRKWAHQWYIRSFLHRFYCLVDLICCDTCRKMLFDLFLRCTVSVPCNFWCVLLADSFCNSIQFNSIFFI